MAYGRRPPDILLLTAVVALLTIGVVMVYSASSIKAGAPPLNDSFYYLKRQLLWAVVGLGAMVLFMRYDYFQLERWSKTAIAVSVVLLLVVLIPGVGKEVLGARRWIGPSFFSIQPSEIAKLAMVVYFASQLSRHHDGLKDFWHGLAPFLGVIGLLAGLILAEPDLGTAVALSGTGYLMLLAAGARASHLGGLAFGGVFLVALAIFFSPYRMRRFTAFLDPWADPAGSGFQTLQALFALGSGGLFGLGFGNSRQKFWYLPEQHTDFIFAITGEELGLMGAALVILLFFVIVWRGLRIAITCPDPFGSLMAVGITAMISLQAIINLGVVSGSLPVTGITLPFMSYGGSSLVFTLMGMGVLLNISRYAAGR